MPKGKIACERQTMSQLLVNCDLQDEDLRMIVGVLYLDITLSCRMLSLFGLECKNGCKLTRRLPRSGGCHLAGTVLLVTSGDCSVYRRWKRYHYRVELKDFIT